VSTCALNCPFASGHEAHPRGGCRGSHNGPAFFLRQAGLFSVYISQEKTRRKVASKLKTRCSASGTVLGLAISNLTLFGCVPIFGGTSR
jgi:hypothetical protein